MNIFARIALAVLLVAPPASAQVFDQTQSLISHTISGPYPMAQSFQPDSTFSSGAGAVVLSSDPNALFDGSTVGLTINLWDMLPNETGATWLAGGYVLGTADRFFDLVYWDPVAVTPGATYFLEFVLHDYALLGLNYSEDERNYAKGTAWAGNPNDLLEPYQVVENFDFTFLTVVRASPAESTVPEPATMTLLATGLAALGATRRKRRTL